MKTLTQKQTATGLKTLPEWTHRAKTIIRTYTFKGFRQSIAFVKRVARKAEKRDHHPDIAIRYNHVTLTLTTHDAGGLTQKDLSLARTCDKLFA